MTVSLRGDRETPEAPGHPDVHAFDTEHGAHLLFVDGSRIYDVDGDLQRLIARTLTEDPGRLLEMLAAHGLESRAYIESTPLTSPPLRALSLAVSQKCNLACSYCYAEGGSFGGEPRNMPW